MIKQKIPNFTPYNLLEVGNNIFSSRFILKLHDYVPIIIGEGDIPRVWLYYKSPNGIVSLVDDNKILDKRVSLNLDDHSKFIRFRLSDKSLKNDIDLITIYFSTKIPHVIAMDLRPLGINMYLDDNVLNVGPMKLSKNDIRGLESVITSK